MLVDAPGWDVPGGDELRRSGMRYGSRADSALDRGALLA